MAYRGGPVSVSDDINLPRVSFARHCRGLLAIAGGCLGPNDTSRTIRPSRESPLSAAAQHLIEPSSGAGYLLDLERLPQIGNTPFDGCALP